MSLPGLQLSAPIETAVVPAVHELKERTEWRFEVAFGSKVEVRVSRSPSTQHSNTFLAWLTSLPAAPLWNCRTLRD